MLNSAKKDFKRRTEFYKNMCRLHFYKYLVQNQNIPSSIRMRYKAKSLSLNSAGIKIKIRNRCIITGRGRAVYRFCKLSRGPLQEKALAGHLNGISKSSW